MAVRAEPQVRQYSAFLSYSREDSRVVRRLHRRLETYRLPRSVAATCGEAAGRRLKPVFLDKEELVAAHDLTQAVRDALARSDHLIVACSPRAARSTWVGREIDLFRRLHGDEGVLAALIDGEPEEAFHPALRRRAHGHRSEPLAADFRPKHGAGRMELLKLVAALAGVGLDDLIHRDAQRRLRQVVLGMGASATGVAALATLSVLAVDARREAESQRERAGTLGEFMVSDLRKGLESAGRHDLLAQVDEAAMKALSTDLSRLTPEQLVQRAQLLQGMGKDAEKRGDLVAAHRDFDAALKTTSALLAAKPDDPKRIFAHAQSEFWIGFINWREGDGAGARAGFEAYARLSDRLVASDPGNDAWRMERAYAAQNLGMLALRQDGDWPRAERYFTTSLAELEPILRHKPEDADALNERQTDLAWLADSQRAQGHLREAAASREAQKQTLQSMLARNPRNLEVKRQLLGHDLAVARIAAAEGAIRGAIALLQAGHAKALSLAAEDPDNKDFRKQARMFELFEASLWLQLPRASRPAAGRIAAVLGDCAPLGSGADNLEISDFCQVLLARLRSEQGDVRGAEAALAPVRQHAAKRHDVLTARWGLDLAAEARPIRLAEGGGR